MADPALVVPVAVDALVVNAQVLDRDGFRVWSYNYLALAQWDSPEPEAFDSSIDDASTGVYLHWVLPAALRSGLHNPATGDVEYPLVPNRWLVVRASGSASRQFTGWVIESDCPFTDQNVHTVTVADTSPYLAGPDLITAWQASPDVFRSDVPLDPTSSDPQVANIGIPFTLPWTERAPEPMFLTAVAPGNPYFSTYTAHNQGVFSFQDTLGDLPADQSTVLSYAVIGWYSDPAQDVMAGWTADTTSQDPFGDLLARLGWALAASSEQPTRSLYEGLAANIAWNPQGPPPSPDPLVDPGPAPFNIALGNTTIDSFVSLLGPQLQARGYDPTSLTLLRTFLYDLLPLVGQPGGDGLVARAIHASWFASSPGGTRWAVVPRPTGPPTAPVGTPGHVVAAGTGPPPGEDPPPPGWLNDLNTVQAELDAKLGELHAAQWTLMADWFKAGLLPTLLFPPDSPTPEQLAALLDPTNVDGVIVPVLDLLTEVQTLLAAVPRPVWATAATSQDAFTAGIDAFVSARGGLPPGQMLAGVAGDASSRAADPVVVLSGVNAPRQSLPAPDLAVRTADQVATALTVDGAVVDEAGAAGAFPPAADFAGLPDGVTALVTELVLVDPASAGSLAAAAQLSGTAVAAAIDVPANYPDAVLPALDFAWQQPWEPMFLEWQVQYAGIPWTVPGASGTDAWAFDGTDYHYTGLALPAPDVQVLGRISLLAPEAQFVFANRLQDWVGRFGGPEQLSQLDGWIDSIDQWQFLSQRLVGLSDLLACRDTRAFRRPVPADLVSSGSTTYPVGSLAGFTGSPPAPGGALPLTAQGHVRSVPYLPQGNEMPFSDLRSGQLYFSGVILYDKFGRRKDLILPGGGGLYNPENFPLVVDPALAPQHTVSAFATVDAVVELPPRFLQPARLEIELLDGAGAGVRIDPSANPVAGWLLPNHLDGSLLLYAPNGEALGEYRLTATGAGTSAGSWHPPPHTEIGPADVARLAPVLAQMVFDPALGDPDAFATFLAVVDAALWMVDPLGNRSDQNLSVLLGRPLALVRAQIAFGLDGPAPRNPGWSKTLHPGEPGVFDDAFAIRLGDQASRDDGLMGYFTAGDYGTFNSVAAPDPTVSQSYVGQIGPLGSSPGNYLWLQPRPGASIEVTLLVDPRAAVHAVTGLLPVASVMIPAATVEPALSNLEISFGIGPVLTFVAPTPAQDGQLPLWYESASYPLPAEHSGTWSWWQPGPPGAWTGLGLVDATADAQFRASQTVVADAALQLVTDLSRSRPSGLGARS
jgi:hypothetical protein